MKKFLLIGLIVAVVLIIVGGAGLVYARVRGIDTVTAVTINGNQNGDKIIQPFGFGPNGMMGENGNRKGPWGMMSERGINLRGMRGCFGAGVMRNYVVSAFASTIGLTVDEVNTRLSNGETLKAIALAQGKTEADLPALASQVWKAALDKAVADGVFTQAQADTMLARMKGYSGFGFDNCPMWDENEVQQP
jgi:hypothetical protein